MPPSPVRYYATFPGQKEPVTVDIVPMGPGRYSLTVHGKRCEVDALPLPHGTVSLLIDGQSYSVELDSHGDDVQVGVKNFVRRIDVVDERRMRLRTGRAGFTAEGKQQVTAPMPGKVVKVLVKAGDEVGMGQGLVVIEAMKMENELKSPKAGKVVELYAQEGAAVEMNAKLVVVE